jgi:tRNA(Arg) A34 adenosine deaminase TadA
LSKEKSTVMSAEVPPLAITLPPWLHTILASPTVCRTDEAKMRFAIELSRQNVLHGTGGPFGAAVFRLADNHLVAAGVNSVQRLHNSVLHAEMIALMLAEARLQSYSLRDPAHELFTSCDTCAMCLGAVLWSGVRRLVCGAGRDDAARVGFDEGPVFPESYRFLEERGIVVVRGALGDEARAVLELYRQRGGLVYNG